MLMCVLVLEVPMALPNYLSSAAYMELFNEARNNDGLDNFYDPALIQDFRSQVQINTNIQMLIYTQMNTYSLL